MAECTMCSYIKTWASRREGFMEMWPEMILVQCFLVIVCWSQTKVLQSPETKKKSSAASQPSDIVEQEQQETSAKLSTPTPSVPPRTSQSTSNFSVPLKGSQCWQGHHIGVLKLIWPSNCWVLPTKDSDFQFEKFTFIWKLVLQW